MAPHTQLRGDQTRERVLTTVIDFKRDNGFAPTVREIGDLCGMSPSAVQYALTILERDGRITRGRRSGRAINVVT